MDLLDFTAEEIQQQLALLGYKNIPKHRLLEFKRDLDELIQRGEWQTLVSSTPTPSEAQSSPPTYIKEKVSSTHGFFLNAATDAHRRAQTLITHPTREDHWQHRPTASGDSYARHSVAPKLRGPAEVPYRLQVETDSNLTPTSQPDSDTSLPEPRERCFMKRKVLRKHRGEQHVCDESVYSEDSDVSSCLQERLAELHLSPDTEEEDGDEEEGDSHSSDWEDLSTLELDMRGLGQIHDDGHLRPKSKSFIRPALTQQPVKRCDPVTRYFRYKQVWDMFKCPGETEHRALRWEIRERLAYQGPPPRPYRFHVPNKYIVPTEKKRDALRQKVRGKLANGLSPYKSGSRL